MRIGDIKLKGGGCPALMLTAPESLDVMPGSEMFITAVVRSEGELALRNLWSFGGMGGLGRCF